MDMDSAKHLRPKANYRNPGTKDILSLADREIDGAETINYFTQEELKQVKDDVENIWQALGVPIQIDWKNVELRQRLYRVEKGVRPRAARADQQGNRIVINFWVYLEKHFNLFELPMKTRRESVNMLRHELLHASGFSDVEEQVADRTYKSREISTRTHHSGLAT